MLHLLGVSRNDLSIQLFRILSPGTTAGAVHTREDGYVTPQRSETDMRPVDAHEIPMGIEAQIPNVEVSVHQRQWQAAKLRQGLP